MSSGLADNAQRVTEGIPPALLAFYSHERDAEPEIVEASWPEIVDTLTTHEITKCQPCVGSKCPSKMGLAFSPAPPTKHPRRLATNVERVYLLVFDFDHITQVELEGVCARVDGFETLLYSTHNHQRNGPDDNCVRLVYPLQRPVTPAEFYVLHREVRRRYVLEWFRPGAVKPSGADQAAKDISRLYFMPTAPEGTTPMSAYSPGGMLNIEQLLVEAPGGRPSAPAPPQASTPAVSVMPLSSDAPVNMEALRQALRDYRPRNSERDEGKVPRKELARRVLHQEPLVKYEETNLRNDSVHRLGSILGHVLPPNTPEEAVLELVRASINALPVYPTDDEGDSLDKRFEVFTAAWKRGLEASESKRIAFEEKQQRERELQKRLRQRFRIKGPGENGSTSGSGGSGGGGGDDESAGASDDDEIPDNWEEALLKTKKDEVWSVGTNVELILDYHPEWRDRLAYNEFTKSPHFFDGVPVQYGKDSEEAITAIQHWFQFEYRINLSRVDIMTVVRHCAKKNSFNPIQEYLNDVTWDRQARLNTWLIRYCGARVVDEEGISLLEHVQRIGRRWMMAAVARALEPGCKADTVLILEGEQGKKKSMVLETLAGRDWFTDSPVHIGQKDAMQIVGTKWIIEMAELSAFQGSETEQQKQFFSSRVDTFRPPFGLTPMDFLRHAIFAGTTNKTNYLNDETGNRRFWPVWCEKILIADLRRDRDQLWAEAVHYFKEGHACPECKRQNATNEEARCTAHRWWFDPKENEELERANNQRLRVNYAEGIVDYLLKLKPDERPTWLTMHDICRQLNISADRIQSQEAAVSRALKSLKFTHKRIVQDGIRMRVFLLPDAIMDAPLRQKVRGAPRKQPEVARA